jgi:predicted nucleic acid-binding protein
VSEPPNKEPFVVTPETTPDDVLEYIFEGQEHIFDSGITPEQSERAKQLIRMIVTRGHAESLAMAIQFPDCWGEFPRSESKRVTPLVPDANVLRNDVLYACRKDRRTILVNAANVGFFRLFCAEHVINEMYEHSSDWTAGTGVSEKEFRQHWFTDYLPLIRCIPDGSLPGDLWSPEEEARIAILQSADPDDVPSARLALAIRGFYLTEDRRAWEAVYGRTVSAEERRRWVKILSAGGDASELEEALGAMALLPAMVVGGVTEFFKWIHAKLGVPGVLLVIGSAAVLARWKTTPDGRKTFFEMVMEMLSTCAGAYDEYQRRLEEFSAAVPDVPSWETLAETNTRDAVRTRACLRTLARESWGQLSAEELVPLLPELPVGQSAQLVRAVLKRVDAFDQVSPGRWQVGMAHPTICEYAEHMAISHPEVWTTHRRFQFAAQNDP